MHLPALFKIELPRQLLRLSPGYPSLAARHASLAAYASADAVLFALRRRPGEPAERRKDLVVALLRMHRSSPHPLWSTLLLLGCAPIVKRLRKDLQGSNPTTRDTILVESFLEVLRSVPTSDPVRIYMYIRQDLRRRVFKALRAELDWRQIGFGEEPDLVADRCTSNVPAIVEARLLSARPTRRPDRCSIASSNRARCARPSTATTRFARTTRGLAFTSGSASDDTGSSARFERVAGCRVPRRCLLDSACTLPGGIVTVIEIVCPVSEFFDPL